MNIKIGILGYGNIGRGVETALRDNPDMELAAVFTRRDPSQVKILSENVPVISVSEIEAWQGGDIVIFERHIGIVSDRRNKNGVPYIIHHNDPWQMAYEQDILEKRTDIVGHYRISK